MGTETSDVNKSLKKRDKSEETTSTQASTICSLQSLSMWHSFCVIWMCHEQWIDEKACQG